MIQVSFLYNCDFCGKDCREKNRVTYVPGVPLIPAEVAQIFGNDACAECIEIAKKVLANRAQAVSDVAPI